LNRSIALTRILRYEGPDEHRETLRRAIKQKRGSMVRMAHLFGMSRRNLMRHIVYAGLYQEMVAARSAEPQITSDPLARALRDL
jgi:DNA-binding NtrC family response regulator